jgi:hypothetical protein
MRDGGAGDEGPLSLFHSVMGEPKAIPAAPASSKTLDFIALLTQTAKSWFFFQEKKTYELDYWGRPQRAMAQ